LQSLPMVMLTIGQSCLLTTPFLLQITTQHEAITRITREVRQ
jgi:hypothetical protein